MERDRGYLHINPSDIIEHIPPTGDYNGYIESKHESKWNEISIFSEEDTKSFEISEFN